MFEDTARINNGANALINMQKVFRQESVNEKLNHYYQERISSFDRLHVMEGLSPSNCLIT